MRQLLLGKEREGAPILEAREIVHEGKGVQVPFIARSRTKLHIGCITWNDLPYDRIAGIVLIGRHDTGDHQAVLRAHRSQVDRGIMVGRHPDGQGPAARE